MLLLPGIDPVSKSLCHLHLCPDLSFNLSIVGKINSDIANVTFDVPQGSILGPLLFLCYVNDMVISIDPDCKLLLYANDSAILFSHKDPDQIANSEKFSNPAQNGLLIINCLFIWEKQNVYCLDQKGNLGK